MGNAPDLTALVDDLLPRWATRGVDRPRQQPTPAGPATPVVSESSRMRAATTVGRTSVLDAGRRLVDDLAAGRRTRHLALVAPAGFGKSRLLQDLVDHAESSDIEVARGRAVATSRGTPYRPLVEAVSSVVRRHGLMPQGALAPYAAALRTLVPAWGAGVPTPGGPPEWAPQSALVRAEAIVAVSQELDRGLLLVLDDLQWADAETIAVLEALIDRTDARLGLLLAARAGTTLVDEALQSWGPRGGLDQWQIGALSPEEAAALADAVAGSPLPPVVAQSVADRSDGVPLVVEELVNALVSTGAGTLTADGSVEVVDTSAVFDVLPAGFAESLAAKMAGLDPESRALARSAALLGREFELDRAGSVAGLRPETASRHVQTLATLGMVERLAGRGAAWFRFDHALTRDAVIEQLGGPELRELAARAVDSGVLGRDAGSREARAELMLIAGRAPAARELLLEAGRSAARSGALATAERLLRRAASPVTDRDDPDEAVVELVRVLALAGRSAAAEQTGRAALDQATGRSAGRLRLALARVAETSSRTEVAAEHVEAATRLLDDDDPELTVVRARVLLAERQLGRAQDAALRALRLAADADQACEALELLSRCARTTDEAAAEQLLERMARLADEHGLSGWRLRALSELGTMDVMRSADGERLMAARRTALSRGDLTTAALVGLHETVRRFHRFEPEGIDTWSTGIEKELRVTGMVPLVDTCRVIRATFDVMSGQRGDGEAVLTDLAGQPLDPDRLAVVWGIGQTVSALVGDDLATATAAAQRGVDAVWERDFGDPSPAWGTWALLAALRDGDASSAAEIRRRGATINRINAGLAAWVDAVTAEDSDTARTHAATALALLAPAPWYAAIALRHVFPRALEQGWADTLREPARAAARFLVDSGAVSPGRALARSAGVATGSGPDRYGLTRREAEILDLVREGLSNAEIADRLVISPRTVEKHVENLLAKTGSSNRVRLAVLPR